MYDLVGCDSVCIIKLRDEEKNTQQYGRVPPLLVHELRVLDLNKIKSTSNEHFLEAHASISHSHDLNF